MVMTSDNLDTLGECWHKTMQFQFTLCLVQTSVEFWITIYWLGFNLWYVTNTLIWH